jgi:hypothetical protein
MSCHSTLFRGADLESSVVIYTVSIHFELDQGTFVGKLALLSGRSRHSLRHNILADRF